MDSIEWSKDFELGLKLIDEEHKKLVGLINKVIEANKKETTDIEFKEVVKGLAAYTQTHFVVEEEYMQVYKYPAYEGHKDMHDDFIRRVSSLLQALGEGRMDFPKSLIDFLVNWLLNHIAVTDRKLVEFLLNEGVR